VVKTAIGIVVVALVATGLVVEARSSSVAPVSHPPPKRLAPGAGTIGTPLVGVLNVSGRYFTTERAAGIDAVTVTVTWSDVEPAPGSYRRDALASVEAEIVSARSQGLQVVLDPGLHYPPAWVFMLPGGTRFVDQYGDAFTGSGPAGNNVANGVTDPAVRAAEGDYLTWLGHQIPSGSVVAVRQGGGPLGELRYPRPDYNGHTNCYWAYDASTQATSPVPGWRPGTGTATQAAAFLADYNANLDEFGIWLNRHMAADFGTTLLVMLPGWGERPGGAALEIASLLTLPMPEFNEGLDWTELLRALPDASHSIAYTTYLDAPLIKPTPQLEDPADYLAALVAGSPIGLGGENTGNGSTAAMRLCFRRARQLGLSIVEWMGEPQLVATTRGQASTGPTFNLLSAGADVWRPRQ